MKTHTNGAQSFCLAVCLACGSVRTFVVGIHKCADKSALPSRLNWASVTPQIQNMANQYFRFVLVARS